MRVKYTMYETNTIFILWNNPRSVEIFDFSLFRHTSTNKALGYEIQITVSTVNLKINRTWIPEQRHFFSNTKNRSWNEISILYTNAFKTKKISKDKIKKENSTNLNQTCNVREITNKDNLFLERKSCLACVAYCDLTYFLYNS